MGAFLSTDIILGDPSALLTSPGGARMPSFAAGFEASADMESILQVTRNLSMNAQAGAVLDADVSGVGQLAANFAATGTLEAELVSISPPPSDYVFYMPFDDLSTTDDTGDHSVTFAGSPSNVTGVINDAILLGNGSSPTDTSTDFVSGSPANILTYSFWFKAVTLSNTYPIGTFSGLTMRAATGPTLLISYHGDDTWIKYKNGVPASSTVFNHFIIEMSGTTSADSTLKLWIDDVEDSTTITNAGGTASTAAKPLRLGSHPAQTAPGIAEFDDFRIYDRVLTSAERTALFEYRG